MSKLKAVLKAAWEARCDFSGHSRMVWYFTRAFGEERAMVALQNAPGNDLSDRDANLAAAQQLPEWKALQDVKEKRRQHLHFNNVSREQLSAAVADPSREGALQIIRENSIDVATMDVVDLNFLKAEQAAYDALAKAIECEHRKRADAFLDAAMAERDEVVAELVSVVQPYLDRIAILNVGIGRNHQNPASLLIGIRPR